MSNSALLKLMVCLLIQLPVLGQVDWEALMREDVFETDDEEIVTKDGQTTSESEESLSTPVDIEPSAVVNNSVNIISGKYQNFEVDFSLPGTESFSLQRAYISADTNKRGPLGKGWCHNYFAIAKKSKKNKLTVMESFGSTLNFSGAKQNKYTIDTDSIERGATNCGFGRISARTNVHNNHWHKNKESQTCLFEKSSGPKLSFAKHNRQHEYLKHYWQVFNEQLLNGNARSYTYDRRCRIEKITAHNSIGARLGELNFRYAETHAGNPLIYISTPTENLARYEFIKLKGKGSHAKTGLYLAKVEREQGPPISYTYDTKARTVKVVKRSLPDNRFEEIEYYAKGYSYINGKEISIKRKKDPRLQRVKQQKAPVGTDATPIATHKYEYSDTEADEAGYALVYDALRHLTRYEWNDEQRLKTQIRYRGQKDYTIYSVERLYWNDEKYDDCTRLKARAFDDEWDNTAFVRSYEYDYFGNVLKDTLWGNITGKSCMPCKSALSENPHPESLVTAYTHSYGSNLVTSQSCGDNTILFAYREGTDLLTSKLYMHKNIIFKREFYEYDENGTITKEIIDDGTMQSSDNIQGVKERKIKYYTLRQEAPVGLPIRIDETYLAESGTADVLCQRTIHTYCSKGRLIAKACYDSQNNHLYTLHWEYDHMGNITCEIDALGYATHRKFDSCGNKVFEQGPNAKFHTEYTYDFMNRLIQIAEVHSDGVTLTQNFKYNYLGQKIASSDTYGHETQYKYDEFGRLIETLFPTTYNSSGLAENVSQKREYDHLNNVTAVVDGRGIATHRQYTILGKAFHIRYPDETEELFEYNLDGSLLKHIEKNKTYIAYTYDQLQRPTVISHFSPTGELLYETKSQYDTFHLISESDAAGKNTDFKYDRAGRLIETKKGDSCTTYEYDTVGRLYKTIQWDGVDSGVVKIQAFDLKNRVIEERTEDLEGNCLSKTSSVYNKDGLVVASSVYTDQGKATTRTYYNSRRLPIKIVDAAGKTSHMHYRYDYRNAFGQLVGYSEVIDAEGNVSISIQDAMGRLHMTQIKDPLGQLVQQKESFYDGNSNKVCEIETLVKDGAPHSTVTAEYTYDSLNRPTSKLEAVGRTKQKMSSITYTRLGQKKTVTTNSGLCLRHKYDLRGRLSAYRASDDSFSYHYTYDDNDNVLSIKDTQDRSETTFKYDSNDRLIEEVLANGLKVVYRYNALNNPVEITLPDQTQVGYRYRGNRLIEVQRLSKAKQVLYTHTYESFDLEGKVTSQTLIGQAGKAHFTYDTAGRLSKATCGLWSENLLYSPTGDLIEKAICDPVCPPDTQQTNRYTYDPLHQLIQEDSIAAHSYTYDSRYNRRSKDGRKHTLNAVNELLSDGSCKYTYDDNGNVIEKLCKGTKTVFAYDGLNRMTAVIKGKEKTAYTYDAQNRRLSKETFTRSSSKKPWNLQTKLRYLYIGQNEVGTCDAEGNALELRILGISRGAEIGGAISLELQDKVYAPIHDDAGNVVGLIDAADGQPVEVYRYSAFGEHVCYDSQGKVLDTPLSPWLFSSKRFDAKTGLFFFGCRYYDPETGRWTTPDPMGLVGGPNLYAYVLNAPLTHFDAYGLHWSQISPAEEGFHYASYYQNISTYTFPTYTPMPVTAMSLWEDGYYHPDAHRIAPVREANFYEKDYFGLSGSESGCQVSRSFNLGCEGLFKVPDRTIIAINGMNTTFKHAKSSAMYLSTLGNGIEVQGVYNATYGPLWDLVECALGFGKVATNPVRELQSKWNACFDEGSPKSLILQQCHSQGAIHVRNALESYDIERRRRIHVLAIAPGHYIDPKTCGDVVHFRAQALRDPIPRMDQAGYLQAAHTVYTLESHDDAPYFDHAFMSPTYTGAIQKTIAEFIKGQK